MAVILSILSFRPDRRKKEAETQDSGASAIKSLTESVATMSNELARRSPRGRETKRAFRDEIAAAGDALNTLQERIRSQTAELETERAERLRLETAVAGLTAELETERTERRRESELRPENTGAAEDAQVQPRCLPCGCSRSNKRTCSSEKKTSSLLKSSRLIKEKMVMSETVVLAVVSDLHTNSTIGLCPPYVELDDGGITAAAKHSVGCGAIGKRMWTR